jgi:hypothetical protein
LEGANRLRKAPRLVLIGIALGLASALAFSRVIAGLPLEVSATYPPPPGFAAVPLPRLIALVASDPPPTARPEWIRGWPPSHS